MYYKFPRSLKGENTIGNFFSFSSIPFIAVGLVIWIVLFYTIGMISNMIAHILGAIITVAMYLLSLFSMPERNIFGGSGQKVYMVIFYVLTSKKNVYVPYVDISKENEGKKSLIDKLFS
ncbi:MAG: hypothetical protein PHN69_06750 [Candidatus Pacebacteria bacterium]|jgi:membrane-bound ClpP family serine protease|nr:hypothetical protein [Candidatus Paceibacterota bacterium]